MQKKLITLKHHADDYECMWNGIEDLYIRETGETLPPSFFFILASFGSFCYMKTPKSNLKRMIALGDGRTKQMYEFLAPIVGFEYKHYEYKMFEQAINKAKSEIDAGYPPVLGALDMYYLPYYSKFILSNLVMFFGAVPTVPNALRGIREPDEVNFNGGFEKMYRVLNEIGKEFGNDTWLKASVIFQQGAEIISEIKDVIVTYLTGEKDRTDEMTELFTKILEIMTEGFILLET